MWLAAALIVLTVALGVSQLDPPAAAAAPQGLASPDAAPVRQALPDLTITKTNNVAGQTTAGSTWVWVFTIRNTGSAAATFTAGQTVLLDNLPSPNVSYPSVTPLPFNAPTGSLNCAVDGASNLTCVASGGGATISIGSGFDVVMQATTLVPGTYVDPRAGGVCRVDPGGVVTESSDANNDCGDTVVVLGPDLNVTKTNSVGGAATVGVPWTWTLTIQNTGNTPTSFNAGQRFLLDTLPNASVTYGAPVVVPIGGSLANATCTIDGASNLACVATGVGAVIPHGSGLSISFQAVASAPGVYANPRTGGTCVVDPDSLVAENSETNNACSNTVATPLPDLTATKSNDVGGAGGVGVPWRWSIRLANTAGTTAATFTNGQRVLLDALPNANVAYGVPAVTPGGGVAGTVNCTIDAGSNLVCVAVGTVTIPVGGTLDLSFTATPATAGSFANPRSGGSCAVDPDNTLVEGNETNNTCSDTVNVGTGPPPPSPPPPSPPPSPPPAPNSANDNDDDKPRLTETQRHQRSHTNASGQDDYRTEGNVLEVRCDASAPPQYEVAFPTHIPYLVIATRDGNQQLRLLYDTRTQCQSVAVGDYAEAEGEKQHELLFDAHDLDTSSRGR